MGHHNVGLKFASFDGKGAACADSGVGENVLALRHCAWEIHDRCCLFRVSIGCYKPAAWPSRTVINPAGWFCCANNPSFDVETCACVLVGALGVWVCVDGSVVAGVFLSMWVVVSLLLIVGCESASAL